MNDKIKHFEKRLDTKHFEKRLDRYGLKYEKNEYGNYRIFLDGLEFDSLRQAKIHMKKKKDKAKRRSNNN